MAIRKAVAYLRTSSRANVGPDKDSDKRQLAAIHAHAKAAGFEVVETFYDAAVSGADRVDDRPGFAKMLERLLSNGARSILVESPDRFARDLMVQLAGQDMLKAKGVTLIAASAPTFFLEDTPTAVLVRQVLGAIAQFEKAGLVAKRATRETGCRYEKGGVTGLVLKPPESPGRSVTPWTRIASFPFDSKGRSMIRSPKYYERARDG